ncbi:MAG: hypothetical protein HYW03_14700, partial [Deltaproteobacteria bacterium]|nr:hypothetical protein [Deltaproteobacteria bacterium]
MLQINHFLFLHESQVFSAFVVGIVEKVDDPLSGEAISIAARLTAKPHRLGMAATLNDTADNPDLLIVIKAVPHPAVADFISTEAGHGSAFFVTAVPASEAALLGDERGLATPRAKITRGCCLMKVSIARDADLCGLQA